MTIHRTPKDDNDDRTVEEIHDRLRDEIPDGIMQTRLNEETGETIIVSDGRRFRVELHEIL